MSDHTTLTPEAMNRLRFYVSKIVEENGWSIPPGNPTPWAPSPILLSARQPSQAWQRIANALWAKHKAGTLYPVPGAAPTASSASSDFAEGAGDVVTGLAMGAQMGAPFGPYGVAIGGAIGAVGGLISALL